MNFFRKNKSINFILLLSYLLLVSVTAVHHHNLLIDTSSEKEYSNFNQNTSVKLHDHSKCLVINFSSLKITDTKNVEKSINVTKEEIILSLENYSIEKNYAFNDKQLRAPPSFHS